MEISDSCESISDGARLNYDLSFIICPLSRNGRSQAHLNAIGRLPSYETQLEAHHFIAYHYSVFGEIRVLDRECRTQRFDRKRRRCVSSGHPGLRGEIVRLIRATFASVPENVPASGVQQDP